MSELTLKIRSAGRRTVIDMTNKVKAHIESNMQRGVTPQGTKMKRLSKTWIKKKGHAIPYLQTGLFYKSVRDKPIKNGFEIYISDTGNRSKIATYLHGKRPFFGIRKENLDRFKQEAFKNFKNL